ncbi:MAG: cytochrome b [Gammaproteobacteria bacterium]|nr:cytochrome b [Gammaproteobacteria bacterium]
MKWRNTTTSWGLLAVLMHWLVAASIVGLFGLGLWMTGLDYYDPWYKQGPDIHRSIGILLFLLILLRLAWRLNEIIPAPHPNHKPWEVQTAHTAHLLLYLLPLAIMVSGYLISTADGRAVSVFGWFEIPALFTGLDKQEELMGDIHELLAWGLIVTAAIHVAGALKHHLIDKDTTLIRMLGTTPNEEETE